MSNLRTWIFRGLVIIVAALIVVSWMGPWWTVDITGGVKLPEAVVVHPYGLTLDVAEFEGFVQGATMPGFFSPLMWTYFGLSILALIFSLFVKNKELKILKIRGSLSSWIIGIVGFSCIVVVIAAATMISIRAADYFDMKLLGTLEIYDHPITYATGTLEFSYWLACATGPLLIILALLRNKITGQKQG
jgi:hypothetical protein